MKLRKVTFLNSWKKTAVNTAVAMLAGTGLLLHNSMPLAADEDTIRLATRPNLPPYIDESATSGIEVDLVKAILNKAGKTVEFVQMDRFAMISEFEQNKVDGTLTQSVSATDHGCITDWYIVHQNVGFTLRNKKHSLKSLAGLADMAVVSFDNAKIFLGEPYTSVVASNPRYKEIAPQSSHINLLYSGEFDVIFGDEWIIRQAQRQHFEKTGEYQELEIHQIMSPTLYSARFQDQAICDQFDAALISLRRSGTYDQIVDDYHQRILVAAKAALSD